jgi:hypothetical protein
MLIDHRVAYLVGIFRHSTSSDICDGFKQTLDGHNLGL